MKRAPGDRPSRPQVSHHECQTPTARREEHPTRQFLLHTGAGAHLAGVSVNDHLRVQRWEAPLSANATRSMPQRTGPPGSSTRSGAEDTPTTRARLDSNHRGGDQLADRRWRPRVGKQTSEKKPEGPDHTRDRRSRGRDREARRPPPSAAGERHASRLSARLAAGPRTRSQPSREPTTRYVWPHVGAADSAHLGDFGLDQRLMVAGALRAGRRPAPATLARGRINPVSRIRGQAPPSRARTESLRVYRGYLNRRQGVSQYDAQPTPSRTRHNARLDGPLDPMRAEVPPLIATRPRITPVKGRYHRDRWAGPG